MEIVVERVESEHTGQEVWRVMIDGGQRFAFRDRRDALAFCVLSAEGEMEKTSGEPIRIEVRP